MEMFSYLIGLITQYIAELIVKMISKNKNSIKNSDAVPLKDFLSKKRISLLKISPFITLYEI